MAGLTTIDKMLTRQCRKQGIMPGRTNHKIFGYVNLYPVLILEEWHNEERR
jgi:hypothetical protein